MNLESRENMMISSIGRFLIIATNIVGSYFITNATHAQVTTDNTLPTKVTENGDTWEITEGAREGDNLFHSFDEFSLPQGKTAFFNNAGDIGNIINRVTGGAVSNIDGLIKANGNANLILINPSGINFGANASLNIGGSFYGSTANSVIFEDGTVFSARDTTGKPLLTFSVPLGLQMGTQSASIKITGEGHNLSVADPLFSPIILETRPAFSVKSGETLALIGKGLVFEGGEIASLGGNIELGSVAEGAVGITDTGLDYENAQVLDGITMRSQSLADASGTPETPGGSIRVRGKNLSITEGSLLLVQNQAATTAGTIEVNTTDSLTVNGTDPTGTIRSSLTNETIAAGKGGNISVTTGNLKVDDGATIVAKTLAPGRGTGGDIDIAASESVTITGANQLNPSVTSSIVTASFGAGDGGNNNVTTKNLNANAGGTIAATTFNTGSGGDLTVTSESIQLTGIEPTVAAPSALTSSTLGTGDAGNLIVDTKTLDLLDGGRVDASTAATGNAGNININASESIEVKGAAAESISPSLIIASGNILDPTLREILQVPEIPTGNSGDVAVNTPQLTISEGAQVTVRNDGVN